MQLNFLLAFRYSLNLIHYLAGYWDRQCNIAKFLFLFFKNFNCGSNLLIDAMPVDNKVGILSLKLAQLNDYILNQLKQF